jgi:hypothetical protein
MANLTHLASTRITLQQLITDFNRAEASDGNMERVHPVLTIHQPLAKIITEKFKLDIQGNHPLLIAPQLQLCLPLDTKDMDNNAQLSLGEAPKQQHFSVSAILGIKILEHLKALLELNTEQATFDERVFEYNPGKDS